MIKVLVRYKKITKILQTLLHFTDIDDIIDMSYATSETQKPFKMLNHLRLSKVTEI